MESAVCEDGLGSAQRSWILVDAAALGMRNHGHLFCIPASVRCPVHPRPFRPLYRPNVVLADGSAFWQIRVVYSGALEFLRAHTHRPSVHGCFHLLPPTDLQKAFQSEHAIWVELYPSVLGAGDAPKVGSIMAPFSRAAASRVCSPHWTVSELCQNPPLYGVKDMRLRAKQIPQVNENRNGGIELM